MFLSLYSRQIIVEITFEVLRWLTQTVQRWMSCGIEEKRTVNSPGGDAG